MKSGVCTSPEQPQVSMYLYFVGNLKNGCIFSDRPLVIGCAEGDQYQLRLNYFNASYIRPTYSYISKQDIRALFHFDNSYWEHEYFNERTNWRIAGHISNDKSEITKTNINGLIIRNPFCGFIQPGSFFEFYEEWISEQKINDYGQNIIANTPVKVYNWGDYQLNKFRILELAYERRKEIDEDIRCMLFNDFYLNFYHTEFDELYDHNILDHLCKVYNCDISVSFVSGGKFTHHHKDIGKWDEDYRRKFYLAEHYKPPKGDDLSLREREASRDAIRGMDEETDGFWRDM